ncbi:MAG: 3-methyladenine DNA glycosylase 2 [Alphaproteobacteria bacterium HGW-Alphaproteobacteria-11]|nr:MAG: 3-methyladenine DNA glycosylase 2 [Alphaproteobacteria bacterium HGW-Alphaproteobacteria-11]
MKQTADISPSRATGLDPDLCYRAIMAKDARFDGRFFVCVRTTGIYCRPVCPAQVPRRENCRFVPSAAAAEALGFRSCLRCRPEAAPGTPAWAGTAASVSRALRLIEDGALDEGKLDDLAARLGMGERQLRRLFLAHVGAGPQAVAANRRLLTAKQLITDTGLPLAQVAHAAGYRSLRRFNDAIRQAYGVAPGEIRRASETAAGGAIRLRLGYRPPFDFERVLAYLGGRAIPGVEQVTAARYARSFRLDGVSGVLSVAPAQKGHALEARIEIAGAEKGAGLPMRRIAARLRRLFDLDAEPSAIAAAFEDDPLIGPRFARAKGLRVPGTFDGFELAIRAVLGQQISVKGATTIAGRMVARFGEPIDSGADGITHFFPAPQRLARGGYAGLGLTGGRIATLKGLAAAVASGALDFSPRETLEAKIAELTALPGIGEWTAHYVALRALGEPDAFPASDLGLRKAAGGGNPVTTKELEQLSQDWRPWRGYAALALWTL